MAHCHGHQEFGQPVARCWRRVSDTIAVTGDEDPDELLLAIERMTSEEFNDSANLGPLIG
jgi:hypothetical protein